MKLPGRIHHEITRSIAVHRITHAVGAVVFSAGREGLQAFEAPDLADRRRGNREIEPRHRKGNDGFAEARGRGNLFLSHSAPTLALPKTNSTRFSIALSMASMGKTWSTAPVR